MTIVLVMHIRVLQSFSVWSCENSFSTNFPTLPILFSRGVKFLFWVMIRVLFVLLNTVGRIRVGAQVSTKQTLTLVKFTSNNTLEIPTCRIPIFLEFPEHNSRYWSYCRCCEVVSFSQNRLWCGMLCSHQANHHTKTHYGSPHTFS